ncbi:MAG: response regulator [Gammaproteobacteria bacterium]|nr:response regulator [Gammaproteobacteria bacterium]
MPEARQYRIGATLHETPITLIRRGQQAHDGASVILKSLRPEAGAGDLARLRHEHLLNSRLQVPGVCPAIDLLTLDGMPTLVSQDVGATALRHWMTDPGMGLARRLEVAIGISRAVTDLHAAGVVHRDINPDNIIVRASDRCVWLIDLGLATLSLRHGQEPVHPRDLEGTLAYLAPEQTGRLPRTVDQRADLYALGATLYELFSGVLPFASDDPLELVHAHLARIPPLLLTQAPQLPPALSELVSVLLEKRPEDRYQHAQTVAEDLEEIHRDLTAGLITTRLKAGARDRDTRFSVPQRLYGRERQRRRLFQFVERAASGASDFILLSGPTGIGKSTLVSAAFYRAESYAFRTVTATFTRAPQTEPAAPVVLAFAPLLRRIVAANTPLMTQWQGRLRHALGRDAQLLAEALPDLATLLAPAKPEPRPATRESGQRFDQAFRRLVEGCTDATAPLLLVLEGCEWIDPDSRRLIQLLTGEGGVPHLLILGTATDTELATDALGPLYPKAGPNHIQVDALSLEETGTLVADVLHSQPERVGPLAARIHAKSHGNPMLALNTLESLRSEELLTYSREQHGWVWNEQALAATVLLDQDSDALLSRLTRLPAASMEPIEVAACIGERFDAQWLASTLEISVNETLQRLRPALQEGFVAPVSERRVPSQHDSESNDALEAESPLLLRFVHSRIHREIYQRLTPERRGALHRRLGDIVLDAAESGDPADSDANQRLFLDAVSQFNFASALPGEPELSALELAQQNLRAGRIALRSGQPQGAFRFLRTGMGQLGPTAWTEHPVIMAQLTSSALDAAFLCADPGQVERLSRAALSQPLDDAIRLRMVAMLTRACFSQGRIADGMETALPELRRQGVNLKTRLPFALSFMLMLREARQLASLPPSRVVDLARADLSQDLLTRSQLLLDVAQNAFFTSPSLLIAAVREMLSLSRGQAPLPETAFALACASAAAVTIGKLPLALRLADRSEQLLQQQGKGRAAARAQLVLNSFVRPWFRAPRLLLRPLLTTFDEALTAGDLDGASQAAAAYAAGALLNGESLNTAREQIRSLERTLSLYPAPPGLSVLRAYSRFINRLMEPAVAPAADSNGDLEGGGESRSEAVPAEHWKHGEIGVDHGQLLRAWQHLLDDDSEAALAIVADLSREGIARLPSTAAAQVQWILALASIDAARSASGPNRRRLLRQARKARRLIARWVDFGLSSLRSRTSLIDAELAAADGQDHAALDGFSRAIHQARSADFDHDEAMAWQRAARFCRETGREAFVDHFLKGAQRAFEHWGAEARIQHLLPDGQTGLSSHRAVSNRSHRSGSSQRGSHLDTVALLEAARTIAGEVHLDELVGTLVGLVLGSSGAERTALILLEEAKLMLAATASSSSSTSTVIDPPLPLLESGDLLPVSVVQYVARRRSALVLEDASIEDAFSEDPYVLEHRPRAVACVPLSIGGRLIGLLYAEHRHQTAAFGPERVEIIRLLAAQAAIGIDNARLYQALSLARDEYRELFDHAAEGIFRLDLDGRLQRGNLALAEALGFVAVDELISGVRFLPRDVVSEPADAVRLLDQIHSREGVSGVELEGFRNDGSRSWFAISARLIRNEDGQKVAIEGSLVDISERRQRVQAEREREMAKAATEAKSRFLANMSHEIRTPMNAILGFSELMIGTALDSRQREFATTIHSAAESLLRLINDILDFSRIEAGQLSLISEPLDLPALLAEMETLFSSSARQKGLDLSCHGGEAMRRGLTGQRPLQGDTGRLRQVLVNLLGNALKFTDHGRIDLGIELLALHEESAEVLFSVEDSGIGIAAEDQTRLFRSFEQGDTGRSRRYTGTGLGLAISHQLVSLMGGELEVASTPDVGSRFSFTLSLPRAIEPVLDIAGDGRPQHAALAGREILLAEDNHINQQLAVAFLQEAGARVRVVDSGAEVIGAVREHRFDAVLMDLHMPGLDGIEACRALRALEVGARLPVIAVTADAAADSIERAHQAGFDDYVVKPLTMNSLISAIERLLPGTSTRDTAGQQFPHPRLTHRLPGVDLARALRNHNGNQELLARLAGQFVELYGNAPVVLARELDAGDAERAVRLAHNLHGVAGSFGAERLRTAARKLEHALERDADLSTAPMEEFGAALAEVVASMQTLVNDQHRQALLPSDRPALR